MAPNQLQDFFREKNKKAKPTDGDWAAKRNAWIKAVDDLYKTIEYEFLKGVKSDVDITFQDKTVKEEHVGEYAIRELYLRVGDEQVVFSPKGVNIVGARGRIDVRGDRGEAMIVWQDQGRWSIVVSRVPTLKLVPLTADSLLEILRGIMRP